MHKGAKEIALTVAIFCASVLVGELMVRVFQIPTYILPAPSRVAIALWRGFASGLYQRHLLHTLTETLLGFLLGSALGLLLGAAVALNRYVEYFFYPYIEMFQSVRRSATLRATSFPFTTSSLTHIVGTKPTPSP